MTPTHRAAMEQALADMVSFESGTGGLYRGEFAESINALRAALAEQPAEQEASVLDDATRIGWCLWRIKDLEQQLAKQPLYAAPQPAKPAERVLNPADVLVEVIHTQRGGFIPVVGRGVRLTHTHTGIVVEETGERSSHANKAKAWEKLQSMFNAAPIPAEQEPITKETYLQELLTFMNANDPSRWEIGFRNIVSILLGPKSSFEIADVVEMVRQLKQPAEQDDYKAWYEEAMCASNEAGFVGLDAAQTIRELARQIAEAPQPTKHPFLVRDLAELIGSTVPAVCNAMEDMGIEPRRSTNAAVTPDEALAVARRLAKPAKRVPLTREQLANAWMETAHITHATDRQIAYGRAIERAHNITGETK